MKVIVDIDDRAYKNLMTDNGWRGSELAKAIKNGTPLDSNSERVEVQAYFDGEAYGWEQGRKALIDDVKAEIESLPTEKIARCKKAYIFASEFKIKVLDILDNIGKAESEDT